MDRLQFSYWLEALLARESEILVPHSVNIHFRMNWGYLSAVDPLEG